MSIVIIKFIIFLFFLVTAAYFSAAETAITSLNTAHIKRIKEKYNKVYKYFLYWEQNSDNVITTLIVLMNVSIVAVGVATTSIGIDLSDIYGLNKKLWLIIIPVVSIITTLIFANLIPKTFARYKAEKYAVKTLPAVIKLSILIKQLNDFLVSISNNILKLFGSKKNEPSLIQPDEVEFLLSNEQTSPLSKISRKIINRIMEFRKTKITQVMVPLSDIVAVDVEQPMKKIAEEIISARFSRVPVYKESINNIIGIITAKDIALAWRNDGILMLNDIIRPVYYVPETAYIKQILVEFQKGKHHIAIVVDEFGSTIGLVTMEDLLEEIVGEVWDEYDEKDKNIIKLKENKYLITASESIADVNDSLKLNIPEDHFSTINGWVLEYFGHIPKKYEKFTWNNLNVEINSVDEKKVKKIILTIK
ncbi:hemolysin family protein [Candidatus Ruminimicrobium bovinum]|uniref:hemolysin family protein n=1 Tax=Candidatus Ruminimicrobium bovinum TaxID=3242779 RepID=UPI0039B8D27B